MSTPESFTCGQCEALSVKRNTPPGTAHPDCHRCGDPTIEYVAAVIAGKGVVMTATDYNEARDNGMRIAETPGVRIVNGVALYSAGWL